MAADEGGFSSTSGSQLTCVAAPPCGVYTAFTRYSKVRVAAPGLRVLVSELFQLLALPCGVEPGHSAGNIGVVWETGANEARRGARGGAESAEPSLGFCASQGMVAIRPPMVCSHKRMKPGSR